MQKNRLCQLQYALTLGLAGVMFSTSTFANAMAVSLDKLYLFNNNSQATSITINNLAPNANKFMVPAHGICKIDQVLFFLPLAEERNNFVIMLGNESWHNPIVIDQLGLLSLASDSVLKLAFSGKVKGYSLLGFCGAKLGQYKFLKVSVNSSAVDYPLSVDNPPRFNLINCQESSNFVYFINDSYIPVKRRLKQLNFAKVGPCSTVTE